MRRVAVRHRRSVPRDVVRGKGRYREEVLNPGMCRLHPAGLRATDREHRIRKPAGSVRLNSGDLPEDRPGRVDRGQTGGRPRNQPRSSRRSDRQKLPWRTFSSPTAKTSRTSLGRCSPGLHHGVAGDRCSCRVRRIRSGECGLQFRRAVRAHLAHQVAQLVGRGTRRSGRWRSAKRRSAIGYPRSRRCPVQLDRLLATCRPERPICSLARARPSGRSGRRPPTWLGSSHAAGKFQ